MRVLARDPKAGSITLQVTSPSDFWSLESILAAGDEVTARTSRMLRSRDGTERSGRVPTTLSVRVEKVSFEPFTSTFRITGKVTRDPDELGILGSYHTVVAEIGSVLTIAKTRWQEAELQALLREAPAQTVGVVALDYDEVTFARVWDYGVETVATWSTGIPGKEERKHEELVSESLEKIASDLTKFIRAGEPVVFAGPGYLKQRLLGLVRGALIKKGVHVDATLVDTSYGGQAGVKEAVTKLLDKGFLEKLRVSEETKLMDRLFSELALTSGRKVAVGYTEVEKSARDGAIQEMLISEKMLKNDYDHAHDLIFTVEKYRGKVHIISEHHEKGEQLVGLGGYAAFLRYAVTAR